MSEDALSHYMSATERMRGRAEAAEADAKAAMQALANLVESMSDIVAERDRLRAVVDAARAYVEAEDDDQCPDTEYFRDGLIHALEALDGSPDTSGPDEPR